MVGLDYDQKRFLAAFKKFYQIEYATNKGKNNTTMHVIAEKMCYLLKMYGLEIGDFYYSWNIRGPFSPGLLALLRVTDNEECCVKEFYANESELNEYIYDGDKIEELRRELHIGDSKNFEQWTELLGSLTYISRTMLPGASFEVVQEKLLQEKRDYSDCSKNQEAWNLLQGIKLI